LKAQIKRRRSLGSRVLANDVKPAKIKVNGQISLACMLASIQVVMFCIAGFYRYRGYRGIPADAEKSESMSEKNLPARWVQQESRRKLVGEIEVRDSGHRERGTAMPIYDDSKTSRTLLGRLAVSPPDDKAWEEFVDRYGPRIIHWCRAWRLQDADVLDVSQAVLTKLSVRLKQFEYDPTGSFRRWLRTLVERTVVDLLGARDRKPAGATPYIELLENVEARADLVRRLEEEFDLELLELAVAQVRQRVAPRTWEAYDLTAREGCPAPEVAARLQMNVATVYKAKSSVIQLLQAEVRKLEGDRLINGPG
jgi:RNA polymerase sigma factor (sigma-70 family)